MFKKFSLVALLPFALLTTSPAYARCASCSPQFICEVKATTDTCPSGTTCQVNDDDCGNWETLATLFPPIKEQEKVKTVEGPIQSPPSEQCLPGKVGPILPQERLEKILVDAGNNWLLATAMHRLNKISASGVYDAGVFAFPLAETAELQKKVLAGEEIFLPSDEYAGFNGFAEYIVNSESGEKFSPDVKKFFIELRVWRINREKLVPTHGMRARLHFEKVNGAKTASMQNIEIRYGMPKPRDGFFPRFKEYPEILSNFLAAREMPKK